MHNVVVAAIPGCETTQFGGLIQSRPKEHWHVVFCHIPRYVRSRRQMVDLKHRAHMACRDLGVKSVQFLDLPLLGKDMVASHVLAEKVSDCLSRYQVGNVYTHNFQETQPERKMASMAGCFASPTLFMTAIGGVPDECIQLDKPHYDRKLHIINAYYQRELAEGSICPEDILGIESYTRIRSMDAQSFYHYFVRIPVYDPLKPWDSFRSEYTRVLGTALWPGAHPEDPWCLAASSYERDRYSFEIDALKEISWSSLVEVGACTGEFTECLLRAFPNALITACEPDKELLKRLHARVGKRAKIIGVGVESCEISADVVFASSCLYYVQPFPLNMLMASAKYFVTSHCARYQKQVVEPAMLYSGKKLLFEKTFAPRVELTFGLVDIKDGTVLQIWENRETNNRGNAL